MRMWDWERKWLMRRGMLGRRGGGSRVQPVQPWVRGHTPALTHTYAQISSEHVLFSPQRNTRVQRLDIENALQITVGHRGRDPPRPLHPSTQPVLHHTGMLVASLPSLGWLCRFLLSCLSHSSWVDGWSVVCVEHLCTPFTSTLCSPVKIPQADWSRRAGSNSGMHHCHSAP